MILFSGSSNPELVKKLAQEAKIAFGKIEVSSFPNKEVRIRIKEKVKEKTCFVLQSFSQPPDRNLIEFCLIVDALVRADAEKVIGIIPWLGYSLQDKVFKPGEPIAARVVANIISNSGVDRVILLELHNESIAGFFSVPAICLTTKELFVNFVKKNKLNKNAVVVSPDFGAMKKARDFAKALGLAQVNINKERDFRTGKVKIHGISNSVKDKVCLIFDDLISTGGTLIETAKILKQEGALKVIFFATHALLVNDASPKLEKSLVDQVVVTDSVNIPPEKKFRKLKILTLAPLFAGFLH